MPEKQTIDRAQKARREGKSASTQAGEFVREEIHHIRERKHGARSTKQAIGKRTATRRPMSSKSLIILSLLPLYLSCSGRGVAAWAHAYPTATVPEDGAVVTEAPRQVQIQFTEGVELEFSRIVVKNSSGNIVSQGNLKRLAEDRLAVDLKPLDPGNYLVEWRALSVDTHITDGVLRFTVGLKGK